MSRCWRSVYRERWTRCIMKASDVPMREPLGWSVIDIVTWWRAKNDRTDNSLRGARYGISSLGSSKRAGPVPAPNYRYWRVIRRSFPGFESEKSMPKIFNLFDAVFRSDVKKLQASQRFWTMRIAVVRWELICIFWSIAGRTFVCTRFRHSSFVTVIAGRLYQMVRI